MEQDTKALERVARYKELFRYEKGKLIRLVQKGKGRPGDTTGCLNGHGYFFTRVDYKITMIHRIIWEMHYGPIPDGFQIDHMNGIRSDNKIQNLRLATATQNRRNQGPRRDSTSGVKGVFFHKSSGKWRAQIVACKGAPIHLGLFFNIEDAKRARLDAERKYFGEFAPSICRVSGF